MLNGVRVTCSGLYLVDLLGGDANRSVQRQTDAGEQGGGQSLHQPCSTMDHFSSLGFSIGRGEHGFNCQFFWGL